LRLPGESQAGVHTPLRCCEGLATVRGRAHVTRDPPVCHRLERGCRQSFQPPYVRSRYNPDLPGVWRTGRYRPRWRRVPVSVRSRSPRRPVRAPHIPRTTGWRIRSRVDGTARASRVGRRQLVRDTILPREGKSQREAHKPEYRLSRREICLRGCGVANIPPEESHPFSGGRMSITQTTPIEHPVNYPALPRSGLLAPR
jgi:hypothetical protein